MRRPAPGLARVFALLLKLQLLRAWNMLAGKQWLRSRASAPARPSRTAAFGSLLFLLGILLGAHWYMQQSIIRQSNPQMVRELLVQSKARSLCRQSPNPQLCLEQGVRSGGDPLRFSHYEDIADQSAQAMILGITLILLGSMLINLGRWQVQQSDREWDWLVQQPISPLPLVMLRSLARSMVPTLASIYVWPFFTMLALARGTDWFISVPLGYILFVLLHSCVTTPSLALELWLRLKRSPQQARHYRVIFGFLGATLLIIGLNGINSQNYFYWDMVVYLGDLLRHSPPGLALEFVLLHDQSRSLQGLAWLLLLVVTVQLLAFVLLGRWLSHGFEAFGLNDSGRFGAAAHGKISALLPRVLGSAFLQRIARLTLLDKLLDSLGPWRRRDLLLMLRDRHFILQSLLLPWLLLAVPYLTSSYEIREQWSRQPNFILTTSFMAGTLFLLQSAFQLLTREGAGLWMLFTWPQPLRRMLHHRLSCWLAAAIFYAFSVVASFWFFLDSPMDGILLRLLGMVWGLGVFAYIIGALAILSFQPGCELKENRPGPKLTYLVLMLAGIYIWALVGDIFWTSLIFTILMTAFAWALWQKASKHLPFIFDPSAAPKAQLTLADGIFALLALVSLRALLPSLAALFFGVNLELNRLLGQAAAAMIISAGFSLFQHRRWTGQRLSMRPLIYWLIHVLGALTLTTLTLVCLKFVGQIWSPVAASMGEVLAPLPMLALLLMACCEEFIFRALLLNMLRQHYAFFPSILMTLLVFILIHPNSAGALLLVLVLTITASSKILKWLMAARGYKISTADLQPNGCMEARVEKAEN